MHESPRTSDPTTAGRDQLLARVTAIEGLFADGAYARVAQVGVGSCAAGGAVLLGVAWLLRGLFRAYEATQAAGGTEGGMRPALDGLANGLIWAAAGLALGAVIGSVIGGCYNAVARWTGGVLVRVRLERPSR
jgi:hypothetical protein